MCTAASAARLRATPRSSRRSPTGARALGIGDEGGTVEPGRRADRAVLDGDPLADIVATGRIRHLVQGGVLRIRDGAEA